MSNNSKKKCSIQKVGYSKGIYGCTAEYFTAICEDIVLNFQGLYGAEHRVKEALEKKNYKVERIIENAYGCLPAKEGRSHLEEHEALEKIKAL